LAEGESILQLGQGSHWKGPGMGRGDPKEEGFSRKPTGSKIRPGKQVREFHPWGNGPSKLFQKKGEKRKPTLQSGGGEKKGGSRLSSNKTTKKKKEEEIREKGKMRKSAEEGRGLVRELAGSRTKGL